jgi:hypothetical protein
MSEWIMEQGSGKNSRNRRLGFVLALVAILYISAVIVFIVVY